MEKKRICFKCNKTYSSNQSLWNHKRRCTGKEIERKEISQEDKSLINRVINGEKQRKRKIPDAEKEIQNVYNKIEKSVKKLDTEREIPNLYNKIEKCVNEKKKKCSSTDGLRQKLSLLYNELQAGNTATKPEIITILKKLEKMGYLNKFECDAVCDVISDLEPETDSEEEQESMDEDGADELDFYQLVRNTADNLTNNLIKNVRTLITGMNTNIQDIVKKYLEGDEEVSSVTQELERMKQTEVILKIKILIEEIAKTRNRVDQILTALRNVEEKDVIRILEDLRMQRVISEDEFKRLAIASNDLLSFAKSITGAGIWV